MSVTRVLRRAVARGAWRGYGSQASPQFIDTCPAPTCSCQPMPSGLDIDRESKMTFGPYREHILVCTGRDDWASKIEMDVHSGPVTQHIKTLLGPPGKRRTDSVADGIVPGKYYNPYSPHIITNASFESPTVTGVSSQARSPVAKGIELPETPTSLYLFPSFQYVTVAQPQDLQSYTASLDVLLRGFVSTTSLATNPLPEEKEVLIEELKDYQGDRGALNPIPVNEVVVLICGHGGRDSRCGVLGLPLQREFEDKLRQSDIDLLPRQRSLDTTLHSSCAHVGLTSHIGGHKWAGNVIIYIPPGWKADENNALSGTAIWYGRVEPKHVEGIVKETIISGRIIKELWRGGMHYNESGGSATWKQVKDVDS